MADSAEPRIEGVTALSRRASRHRRLRAGEGGIVASPLRLALRAAAAGYSLVTAARNALYDRGILSARKLEVPVVSVGNLVAGGTGKTPMVAVLATAVSRAGWRPAILTRGYRHGGTGDPDEVGLLRRYLPGIPIIVDPDRVRGGREALAAGADLLLLDDGFQHRRLARDVDVVLLDARDPFGGGMLPHGLRREGIGGLGRADAVVITRADRIAPAAREALAAEVAARRGERARPIPILFERHAPVALVALDGAESRGLETLRGARVVAFSGIADPRSLVETLGMLGAYVLRAIDFGDHHEFGADDVGYVAAAVAATGADLAITTEKDAIRLLRAPASIDAWALRIAAEGLGCDLAMGLLPLIPRS
jgi:tetraacyldisaccharide 4'-kinase